MSSLAFYKRFYRGEVFEEWLRDVRFFGFADGSKLVDKLGRPRPDLGYESGMADNVYAADCFLAVATKEGVIERLTHNPSREQCFFGVGGLSVKRGKPTVHSRPVEFSYRLAGNP